MAANWPKLPALDSPDELEELLPEGWRLDKIENLYEQLPVGKRFDQKSSSAKGKVPVIDQSEAGVIGWHDEEPGVMASDSRAVVTFANHTCEMRLMRRPFSVIQNVFPLVGRSNVCDTRFLYYGTKGRVHLEEYKGHFPDYRRKWIPVPPLSEQRAIAHILGTLDDKIELNRRMSETLEAIARALFESWFVRFEPVRRNMARKGRGQPSPAASRHPLPVGEGRSEGVAGSGAFDHLFPDSFEDSELGEIPRGWRAGRFGDVVEQLRDQENPLLFPDVLYRHFSLPAFDDGQNPKAEYGESIKSLKSCVPPGAVLLSKLNPEIERVWLVDVGPSERAVCSTEFLVLRARPPFTRSFVYCLARSPLFRQQIEGLVTGTSKSHQRAQVESILDLGTIVPPLPIVAAFDRAAESLLARTLDCRRESRTLAALRDALLPKLISGELRVKDAERFLKERAL